MAEVEQGAPNTDQTTVKDAKDLMIEQLTARVVALEEAQKGTIADLTKANNDLWAYLHPATGGAVVNKEPTKETASEPFDMVKAVTESLTKL